MAEKKHYEFVKNYGTRSPLTAMAAKNGPDGFIYGIIQGTTQNTRIGNRIHVSRIQFSVRLCPAATMATGGLCRLIVMRDKFSNGGTPSITDIFTNDPDGLGSGGAADVSPWSLRNPDNLVRFNFLYDRIHSLVSTSSTTGGPLMDFSFNVYPKDTIVFDANAGTAADIVKNNYWIVALSSDGTCCQLDLRGRVWFTDM